MSREKPVPEDYIDGTPKWLNEHLLDGVKNLGDLENVVAEVRRHALAIMPHEIKEIQDARLRSAIEKSFVKVGEDMAKLAGGLEMVIKHLNLKKQ